VIRKTVIDRIKALLTARGGALGTGTTREPEEYRIAAAALLVEAARLDDTFDARERATILDLLTRRFDLDRAAGESLLRAAEARADGATGLHRLTHTIKSAFDHDQRIELLEMLWEVAYADGELHDYEASLIRRVTGLLHVSDHDCGAARKRVLTRRQVQGT